MAKPITVPQQDVDDLRAGAQDAIRDAGLVEAFRDVAGGPYGSSVAALGLLGAIETGIACLVAARAAIAGRIAADRRTGMAAATLTPDEHTFCSLVAVHIGAQEALAACALEPSELPPPGKHLKLTEYRELLTRPTAGALVSGLLPDLAAYLRFYRDNPDDAVKLEGGDRLRACVGSYLALISGTAIRLADDGEHAAALHGLRDAGLSINGAKYEGLDRHTALPVVEEAGLLPLWPPDIVGNEQVLSAGLSLARAVAGFDMERGENPRMIRNPVLFVLGSPGCGKTVTAHAIGNYFLDLCKENEIQARFRIIRRTDWASHYQNKSANQLLQIFRREVFEYPGVAGVYWPDIDTAFAAREDPGIRAEEKAILGTLFGLLDGTVGPRNGKWFMICDANFLTMDEATLSRLSQDPHHAKGPETVEQFVELFRDKKLAKIREHLLLSDEEWREIAERCVDAGLSGRAVDNISGKLLSEIEDVDVPDSYFRLSYDEKVEMLASQRRDFDYAYVNQLLDRYVKFEKEAEDRARTERFERRVNEIREQLAARIAAVGGGADE